jgi:hypothetical protein
MSCREWDSLIRPWLNEQSGREHIQELLPQDILAHTQICGSCSRRLRAALMLLRGEELRCEPEAGLVSRVRARLEKEPGRKPLVERKVLRVAMAAAAVLVVALAVGFLARRLQAPDVELVEVHLILQAPQAKSVSVVGDWNAWDPGRDRLRDPNGDGIWEIRLRLQKGAELRYQFLIDGERWIPDPHAPLQVDDGFGGTSSVLQI